MKQWEETTNEIPRDRREVVEIYRRSMPTGESSPSAAVPENPWQCPPEQESRRMRRAEKKRAKRVAMTAGGRSRKRGVAVFAVFFAASICLCTLAVNGVGGRYVPTFGETLPDGSQGHLYEIATEDQEIAIPTVKAGEGVAVVITEESGDPLSAQEIYQTVNPAVVTVVAAQSSIYSSVGTGVIFTADGYLLTNAHVIEGGQTCYVILSTGARYETSLVGYDEINDVAVLKTDENGPFSYAALGNSDALTVGDAVYAIGNPLGVELRGTLTNGIVSAINRDVEVKGRTMTLIQTNAALNQGNSGGPLINEYGQVVGLNTVKMSSESTTVEGLGFAIPSRTLEYLANQILQYGYTLPETSLGITVAPVTATQSAPAGVMVYEVIMGSCADAAGIRGGDIITEADGQILTANDDLLRARRCHAPGEVMRLKIWRGGTWIAANVTLDAAG